MANGVAAYRAFQTGQCQLACWQQGFRISSPSEQSVPTCNSRQLAGQQKL